MVIREFDLARDFDAVTALWQASGPGVRLGLSDTPEEITRKLKRDPDLFLVAENEAQVVGAVLGGFDGRRGMVYHLAVTPEARGRGLGTALMAELEARLKAKGCRKYYLLVTHDNTDVTDFYQRLGWSVMPVNIMGKEIR
ncbi:MAG: GCN5-related N-acetyltransferase [Anaerolineales bacterium]|nr:GCN5-related N-acetyltransferase [Anaerolineales bacterium]MBM2849031.1 GCN5-related N-acetyltransferase [Anaerolineales bacterium]